MRIESVNTSTGREVEYRGEPVRTGIFKRPIVDPLPVHTSGCDGDEQSDLVNHGGEHKAVYAFGLQHYPHWQQVLGRSYSAGAFGENLSVSELDEKQVHLGDRFRAGDALLEVSQPRNPCFKLGIALGDERAPALFTLHFHTGVYFRVLEAGTIRAGDELVLERPHPSALSVHALFRAKHDRNSSGREQVLRSALEIEELAPEWQAQVEHALQAY
ncbi:MOSC domain-containing protein [Haliea sp. E17]|uniref:MOSC domain-containing protein n=1 Tax=Haliea sp. E17 TaxID=3401576 RepID=UPI003AABF15E